jgi:hypothetical protein
MIVDRSIVLLGMLSLAPSGAAGPVPVERSDVQARLPPASLLAEFQRLAAAEAERWSRPRAPLQPAADVLRGESWVSLGPTDATYQYNGVRYTLVDAGRIGTVAVDPRTPEVVFIGTPGGAWKTWNFVSATPDPDWQPITDGLPGPGQSTLAIDPGFPDTVYVATGDPFDRLTGSSTVYRSDDGGGSWTGPSAALAAAYPVGAGGFARDATWASSLAVDPADPRLVWVTTDVGLLRSTDGGASFEVVDLPNAGAQVAETAFRIALAGSAGPGATTWLVSGAAACAPGLAPPGMLTEPAGPGCTSGTPGDLWRSEDSGATWTSLRATTGAWPAVPLAGIGRIELATEAPAGGAPGAAYAVLASQDSSHSETVAIWRSLDGGRTWANATGVLANPAFVARSINCASMDLGHGQSWYDLAVGVDPANPDRVIVGGDLCAVRTRNGTAASPTWENVAYWLPGIGATQGGVLPSVHADWHHVVVSRVGGTLRVLSGSDGGLYSSSDVFASTSPEAVSWAFHNRGVVSHLCFGVGSGDPADGNGDLVVSGLQDNGVRFRNPAAGSTTYDQVLGGDGGETVVTAGSSGTWIWAGQQPASPAYCHRPPSSSVDCGDQASWVELPLVPAAPDSGASELRLAAVSTDPTGATVLIATSTRVYQSAPGPGWQAIGGPFSTPGGLALPVHRVAAATSSPGLFGASLNVGKAAVSSDGGLSWTVAAGATGVGGQLILGAAALDFPPASALGGGQAAGDVYVLTSTNWTLADGAPVPAAIGHIFRTTDRGATFQPISGAGGASPLPDVPIEAVRFDPGDPGGLTLYAGTDLGVYRTTDGGLNWERLGTGMPMAKVTGLFLSRNQALLRASTFGRGLWEIYPQAPLRGVAGSGDFDLDGRIDWTDLAALASRLGTTPATATWPTYSWLTDLVGSTPEVDEADLVALLARFGGPP